MLIRGASGAGKSTLALRCMQAGFRLVADDRVIAWGSGRRLFGRAPGPLAALIEVRGIGVLPAPLPLTICEIDLVIDLMTETDRMPEPQATDIAGLARPLLRLSATDADLPLRLRAALAAMRRHL